MPIQVKPVASLHSVKQRIDEYEQQYGMTSEAFAGDAESRAKVPEFDAIEWSFLLMQKAAMEEDDECGTTIFSSRCKSKTHAVDVRSVYGDIAA